MKEDCSVTLDELYMRITVTPDGHGYVPLGAARKRALAGLRARNCDCEQSQTTVMPRQEDRRR